jgi:uncharacterized protein
MSNAKQRRAQRRDTAAAPVVRDGLANVVAGLGNGRDKMSYTEWTMPRVLDRQTLSNMYRSSWLAKKIINLPAEDMTRAWREFNFDDNPETTEDEAKDGAQAMCDAELKFQLQAKVQKAVQWARLFGGASILLGVGNPNDYSKPLDVERIKKGDLKFMITLDRWTLIPTGQIVWDITDSAFGQPEYYTIAANQGSKAAIGAVKIHHSRVVRFLGQELPFLDAIAQTGWGDSELQHVYDTLTGRDTTTAAIATMVFEANVDVVKAPELASMLSTSEGEAMLLKRFQSAALLKSFNRMLLLDGAEDYDKKSNAFSGLDAIMREFRAEVSGAADIPVTRLFGTSVGGLNATGDNEIRNYYDSINAKQEAQLRPALDKIDAVLMRSELGVVPEDVSYTFCPLWQMSDKEKADVQKVRADRDKVYFDMGVITEGVVARQLKQDGTYPAMTEEDVSLAEELAAALEEQRMNPPDPAALPAPGAPGEDPNADPVAAKNVGEEETPPAAPGKAGKAKP